MKGKINIYTCEDCHYKTITIDKDEGTTPFMIRCTKCKKGFAISSFYKVPQFLKPEYEWYIPISYHGLDYLTIDHVSKGGLLLRKIINA